VLLSFQFIPRLFFDLVVTGISTKTFHRLRAATIFFCSGEEAGMFDNRVENSASAD
jgi:hypothetical protein